MEAFLDRYQNGRAFAKDHDRMNGMNGTEMTFGRKKLLSSAHSSQSRS